MASPMDIHVPMITSFFTKSIAVETVAGLVVLLGVVLVGLVTVVVVDVVVPASFPTVGIR